MNYNEGSTLLQKFSESQKMWAESKEKTNKLD